MVSSLTRGGLALLLVGVGAGLLWLWHDRSALHTRGLVVEATVREIYESDTSQEAWLEYSDSQGQSHWLHGPLAARRNAKVRVKYDPAHPDRAVLAEEATHFDYVTLIFGLYALGAGLFMGYRLWKN